MRCPFCKSELINVIKGDLIVADDKDAKGGKTSSNGFVYDEDVFHYECENKHIFFGANPARAEKAAQDRPRE